MLLSTIITELGDESRAAAALMELGDIVLVANIEAERRLHGESAGEYVSGAVRRFAGAASDNDWLALMTALERAENPASACLGSMLRWSLARDACNDGHDKDGCSCGRGGGCHESP